MFTNGFRAWQNEGIELNGYVWWIINRKTGYLNSDRPEGGQASYPLSNVIVRRDPFLVAGLFRRNNLIDVFIDETKKMVQSRNEKKKEKKIY